MYFDCFCDADGSCSDSSRILLYWRTILLRIPSKKEKCLSDDNFVVSYPFGLRFCKVSDDGFLFVSLGLFYANGRIVL